MRIPSISGTIARRILVNFRIDAEQMAAVLPAPFRPQLVKGYAIGGICLIRLKNIRPKFLPIPWGISSENAVHRIAVMWEVEGQTQCGMYIPRRDTDSRLYTLASGTVFPDIHHYARFQVKEDEETFSVSMQSKDAQVNLKVTGTISPKLPAGSVFGNIQQASEFFEQSTQRYSNSKTDGEFEGLELQCQNWQIMALDVSEVQSSYFEDRSRFTADAVQFDCALLMRSVVHEWHARPQLCGAG